MLKKVLGILLVALALAIVLARSFGGSSRDELLAYTLSDRYGKTSLLMYDTQFGISVPVYTDSNRISFSFSANGRLAFSSAPDAVGQIHILDTVSGQSSAIDFSQNPAGRNYPLAWSPDGHYLAFASSLDDKHQMIYVWDGKKTINITPGNLAATAGSYYETSWSFDGRLAFTVFNPHGNSTQDDPSEIYLWDGKTTISLSQNPTGVDRFPTWSTDGRLAFLSERNGNYDIFVWDGPSMKDSSPEIDTFTNISPKLTYYSDPVWTNKGLLAFMSESPQDHGTQIYRWDGQAATNISQNPTLNNGSQTWSTDGRWAFSTFFSSNQLVYVRDAQNNPLLTVTGQYPAWSSSGYLTFCTPGWALSIWDGRHFTKIAQGAEIVAQWQNSSRNVCSSG